jgi:glucose dehydrogenase
MPILTSRCAPRRSRRRRPPFSRERVLTVYATLVKTYRAIHQNYQGHRFSGLKEINADTVGSLRLAFTVGLGGLQAGGRHAQGNLEATPLVDDGIMYVTDGWGSVYAIDVRGGRKGETKWKFDPGVDRGWAGHVACCGVNTAASRCGRTR